MVERILVTSYLFSLLSLFLSNFRSNFRRLFLIFLAVSTLLNISLDWFGEVNLSEVATNEFKRSISSYVINPLLSVSISLKIGFSLPYGSLSSINGYRVLSAMVNYSNLKPYFFDGKPFSLRLLLFVSAHFLSRIEA